MDFNIECICRKLYILIVFISIFSFSKVAGQKSIAYKYNYRFQLDNRTDTNTIAIELLQGQETSGTINGKVMDRELRPCQTALITLKTSDTTIYIITDSIGQFHINARPSNYELTISDMRYNSVQKTIIVDDRTDYNLTIKLTSEILPIGYNIYSKRRLTKVKVQEIKRCVEANEGNLINYGEQNEYYISFEI